jgi:hypothetical protein
VPSDDPRTVLRSAIHTSDAAAVLALLQRDWPDDAPQLIGDGLAAALRQGVPGASDLADRCSRALRVRGWEGDQELADDLDAIRATAPTPLLRRLPVDLEELSLVLEGDPLAGDGRVDLRGGQVWPHAAIEYAQETGEEDDAASDDLERWLWIPNQGSRAGYRDLVDFVGTVADPGRADRLDIALQGRGAFRRFKDVLARWPGELARWYGFSDDRRRGRARAWLAEEGFAPRLP